MFFDNDRSRYVTFDNVLIVTDSSSRSYFARIILGYRQHYVQIEFWSISRLFHDFKPVLN